MVISFPICGYAKGKEKIYLDSSWKYADHARIASGYAVMYKAKKNRKDIVIAVNAGHGTKGGSSVKTLCHPDGSAKVTGGTTAAGSVKAVAVSDGMAFRDGTAERDVTLRMARILKKKLLAEGYDVLMVRDGKDAQLDNVARTVILHCIGTAMDFLTTKDAFMLLFPKNSKKCVRLHLTGKNMTHWENH